MSSPVVLVFLAPRIPVGLGFVFLFPRPRFGSLALGKCRPSSISVVVHCPGVGSAFYLFAGLGF
jgi:hypothetical protein